MRKALFFIGILVIVAGCKHHPTIDPIATTDSKSSGNGLPIDSGMPDKLISDQRGNEHDLGGSNLAPLQPVFFDYNSYQIRQDQSGALESDNTYMRSHVSSRFLIEGHCDERGTEEYNLALGARRADVTKDYLISLGIPENRLTTISYGESKPFAKGHDESDWQQNRRAQVNLVP